MLESLEQEYRRDEDWCGGHDKLGPLAESDHVFPLISKHLEQKEAFLKVKEEMILLFSKFYQSIILIISLYTLFPHVFKRKF